MCQPTINVKAIFESIHASKSFNDEELNQIDLALQAMGKRVSYCDYHYAIFIPYTESSELTWDRLDARGNRRIAYEANALAFLQNLHALLDSLPYYLNLIHRKADVDNRSIGWNFFIDKYKHEAYFDDLKNLKADGNFDFLKAYINVTKHKHLTPIKNDYQSLSLSEFKYDNRRYPSQNLAEFMAKSHNELLPKYIKLINTVSSIYLSN